jgi:hypothetical protein
MNNLDLNQIIQFLTGIQFWSVVKALVCFALLLYALVALVVFKQVQMMADVLDGQMNPAIKAIALFHLLGAILVFLIALVIL